MTASLLLSLLLAAFPMVATDSACPSTRSIETQLRKLLSPEALPGKALVEDQTDRLVLRLQPDGAEWAERIISVAGSCEDRAMAAAVAIATWWQMGSRPTEVVPASDQAAITQDAHASVAPPAPGAANESRWQSRALPGGAETREGMETLGGFPYQRPKTKLTMSVAGFASFVPGDVGPGARIGLDLAWWERLSVRMGLSATGAHTASFGGGKTDFQRVSGELGMAWSHRSFQIDGMGLVSRIYVEGSGYQQNQKSAGTSFGLSMAGRWGWSSRRAGLWLEARGILWPQSQRLFVSNPDGQGRLSRDLPHVELQLGAGLSFRLL